MGLYGTLVKGPLGFRGLARGLHGLQKEPCQQQGLRNGWDPESSTFYRTDPGGPLRACHMPVGGLQLHEPGSKLV